MSAIPTTRSNNSSRNVYDALPDDDYPARISRFVGLGIHDQPDFQGQKKAPAFKCQIAFELIGRDATGKKGDGTPLEPSPACQFKDYFLFPGAKRGGVFELCQAIDPSLTAVPKDMSWFIKNLGAIVNVRVGHYVNAAGQKKNKVVGVSAIPSMFKSQVGPARLETVGFDPYMDTPEMFGAYSQLWNFQRETLTEAHDSENIVFAGKEAARPDSKPASTPQSKAPDTHAGNTNQEPPMDFDDDIPF